MIEFPALNHSFGRSLRGRWGLSLLVFACGVGLVLLYVPGPDYYSPRLIRSVWGTGHLLLFCLLGLTLGTVVAPRWRGSALSLFLLSFLCLVLIGAATELLQNLTPSRDPSTQDWWVDMWGGLLGLALSRNMRVRLPELWRRALPLLVLPGVLLCLLPLAVTAADDWVAYRQFPVLSGLENPLEMTRWRGNAPYQRTDQISRRGCCSLEADLQPGLFSGVGLHAFPGDWRGYRNFHMDVWSARPVTLTLRINDLEHDRGSQQYSDRFNRQIRLRRGWNVVDIPLAVIARAPAGRSMDMANIRDIGLFSYRLDRSVRIYIDNVRLSGQSN